MSLVAVGLGSSFCLCFLFWRSCLLCASNASLVSPTLAFRAVILLSSIRLNRFTALKEKKNSIVLPLSIE